MKHVTGMSHAIAPLYCTIGMRLVQEKSIFNKNDKVFPITSFNDVSARIFKEVFHEKTGIYFLSGAGL